MATIELNDICLDYPTYDFNDMSLKRILLRGARKSQSIKSIRALENINLKIETGERIGLHGPNGSGKTTLLRTIAGIYPPTSGSRQINGRVTPLLGLAVGANLEISAEDNIRLLLRIDGIRPTTELIDAIWRFTDLSDDMRRLPLRTFSSGMVMRVLFSVSTSYSPEILLLDEWLSVVDEKFSIKAEQRMKELINSTKILVIASHNYELLERVCTRIVRMDAGTINSQTIVEKKSEGEDGQNAESLAPAGTAL